LLLSDGADDGAMETISFLLEKHDIKTQFTINTFGLGKDHDAVLMDDLAKLKDGCFYYIDKAEVVAKSL
jgi:hypothetical protein